MSEQSNEMWRKYKVVVETVDELLGTQPTSPAGREFLEESTLAKHPEVSMKDEEVPLDEEHKVVPRTTFYVHDGKICIMNYQLKGYLKEAAKTLPHLIGIKGRKVDGVAKESPSAQTVKGFIDRFIAIQPRHIFFHRDDEIIEKPETVVARPLRGWTIRGERVALVESDAVKPPITMDFEIWVINKSPIKEEALREWLAYGEMGVGLLGWRGVYGHFKVVEFGEIAKA